MQTHIRKQEVSAGGLIVSRDTRGWWILLMKDKSGKWTFPKGKIEDGEKLEETAAREIAEEVGITGLRYIGKLAPSTYWYFREGSIHKTVHYFVFAVDTRQTPTVQTEEGITEAAWVRMGAATKRVGYPKTNKPLLVQAQKLLRGL